MKIALCLHGLFNSTTDQSSNGLDGYEYINKHILSKGNVDVYIHSWEEEMKNEILNIYNPINIVFEKPKDFSELITSRGLDTIKSTPRPINSVISHLYSVTESIKLALNSNVDYDIIIKSRFDLGRINRNTSGPNKSNPYPVQCIKLIDEIDSDKLYMANWNHFHMGPADMWFYGSKNIMMKFTELFTFLEKELYLDSEFHEFATNIENNRGDLSNSIAFYKFWMIKNNLWDKRELLDTTWE